MVLFSQTIEGGYVRPYLREMEPADRYGVYSCCISLLLDSA
jgi:hypothetical protein